MSESPVITEFGDSISGGYTLSETSTQDYSFSELNSTGGGYMGGGDGGGGSYSLSETGDKAYSRTESGSHATGQYSLHETGTDSYTIAESGGTSSPGGGGGGGGGSMSMSGSYSTSSSNSSTWGLTLSGADNYTTAESGNELSGLYSRATSGGGADNLSESGSIAQNPYNSTPATGYTVSETGNYLSGQISLGETGLDRYALINGFNNVSNTQPTSNGPGDIDYSPVGAPFDIAPSPFHAHGPAAPLNAAASDAAFNELGLQLLHEYCWAGDTPLMADFEIDRPIESALEGQSVLCADEHNPEGPRHLGEVGRFFANGLKHVIHLYVEGRLFRPTPNHPIYARDRGFVPAAELRPGDELLTDDHRWVKVTSIVDKGEVAPVYNLMVPNGHTYFVGSKLREGFCFLVHNESEGARYKPGKDPSPPQIYGPEPGGGAGSPSKGDTASREPSVEEQRAALHDEYNALLQEFNDNTGTDRSKQDPNFDMMDWFGRVQQWAERMAPLVADEHREEFSAWKSDLDNFIADAKSAAYLKDHPRGEVLPDNRFRSDLDLAAEAKADMHWRIWNSDQSTGMKILSSFFMPGGLMEDVIGLHPRANAQGRLSRNGRAASRPGPGVSGSSKGSGSNIGAVPPILAGRRGARPATPNPTKQHPKSPALQSSEWHPDKVNSRIRPRYRANPAHNPAAPEYNKGKTAEPADAQKVYEEGAVRGNMGTWYGKNSNGDIYRYSSDGQGGVHFSGSTGPGKRSMPMSQIPKSVRDQLDNVK